VKDNIEAYSDWEMKVEQLFACHQINEERKVSLVTFNFQGYIRYWWTAFVQDRICYNDPTIKYWDELKTCMRRKFLSPSFKRNQELK